MDDDDVDGTGELPGDGDLGPLAVSLLLIGAALTIAGLTTLVPGWLLVVGLATFTAGAAVPLWSSWRRRHDEPGPTAR